MSEYYYNEDYQTCRSEVIDELEQENRLLRARNDRLEAEVNAISVKNPKKGSYEAVFGHLDMTPDQLGNYMIELKEKAALHEAHKCKWPNCQTEEYQQDLAEQIKRELVGVQQEPVGAIILGGTIDTGDGPEYEEWDVEWNTKAVEALQEKLVTSNGVTLMLYTTPAAAQRQWVGLTDDEWDEFSDKYGMIIFGGLKQEIEAKLKEKNT